MLLAATGLGILWAIQATDFNAPSKTPQTVILLLVGAIMAGLLIRNTWYAAWLALVYTVAVGTADRVVRVPWVGSDVLSATSQAIHVLGGGHNPYAHTYQSAGGLVPYPPGELFYYAIPHLLLGHINTADTWAGIAMLFLLAALAGWIGPARAALATALYATFELAAFRATDGSNDTSFAFLVVFAVFLLVWSEHARRGRRTIFIASAVFFAWALLFKQFAILLYPFVGLYLWRRRAPWLRHAIITLGLAALVALPFFVTAPAGFKHNVLDIAVVHDQGGLNIWAFSHWLDPTLDARLRPWIPLIQFAAIGMVGGLLLTRPAANLGVALFQGLAVWFAALFFARWTTSTYYTGASAIMAAAIALVWTPTGRATARSRLSFATFGLAPPWTQPALPDSSPLVPVRRPVITRPGVLDRLRALSRETILVLAATMAGAGLRLADLTGVPPGLHQDEALTGYDAYSLFLTGRDHLGHPFSLAGLEGFGDWVSPLLTILTAPAVGIFGLKVSVVRAVAAVIGILAIPLVYRLGCELFRRRLVGVIAAWFVALLPWAVHVSRFAVPPTLVPALVALTMFLIVCTGRRQRDWGLVAIAAAAGLTVISYPTMKLYIPLLCLAAAIIYRQTWRRLRWEAWLVAAIVFLALAGPNLFLSLRDPAGKARFDQISLFHTGNVGPGTVLRQYWAGISPHFLFVAGDGDGSHLPIGTGVLLRAMIPFLIAGLIWLALTIIRAPARSPDRTSALFLLAALLLAPVPGALTVPSPHDSRLVQLIPLAAVIAALGVVAILDLVRSLVRDMDARVAGVVVRLVMVAMVLTTGAELYGRYNDYFREYPKQWTTAWYFAAGLDQALVYAREHEADYDEIWVADTTQPYIYVLFVNRWSPSDIHDNLVVQRRPPLSNEVYQVGKYHFPGSLQHAPADVIQAANHLIMSIRDPGHDIVYNVRDGTLTGHGRILLINKP